MFLEKRVYQGSSGRVYPCPVTERVSDEKVDRTYQAVFLENEYLRVMILPEIGGRVHEAFDKTSQYHFIYNQHVIKPALVGLLGPWISGGIEFNWPQHHRPSTFMPVDHFVEEDSDGGRTVWLSEHDPLARMKGMVGISLRPGSAVIEAKVRLYNRTPFVQTFLWWANVGIRVHDQYQAFFPPDVTCVADHAKRAVSEFPMARGHYYGVDYSPGVDLTWYKNIPVPTSYMVTKSLFDFFGGYDHGAQAGIVHVADHHVSPGKKLWTWSNSEFGYAWDRELTDSDGPYIELMAGVFTDNQPDFSFLQPYETKTFSQCLYPIQKIGCAKNANRFLAVNLETANGHAHLGACSTEAFRNASICLFAGKELLLERRRDLLPGKPYTEELPLPAQVGEFDLLLRILDEQGKELIAYAPKRPLEEPLPPPAAEPPLPEELPSTEALYLTGLHLEQYRHATRYPEPYWQEALRRDPEDARCNNALGLQHLRRGEFEIAEAHFRRAIKTLTRWNPNPYDGEPYYNLGLALKWQGRDEEAYGAFSKAVWNYAWQASGYYALAELDCGRKNWISAIEHLERSLSTNAANLKARNLKAAVLRRMGKLAEAEAVALGTVALDRLDFWSRNEQILISQARGDEAVSARLIGEWTHMARGEVQTLLDVTCDYAEAGLWEEAQALMARHLPENLELEPVYPMLLYAAGFLAEKLKEPAKGLELYRAAERMPADYCFPSRLEEMRILERALAANPEGSKAFYYLGNLLYDKRRYEEAISRWETSCRLNPDFSIPWRNLGIAYFNTRMDRGKARECYKKALAANPQDSRILYEFDQLAKRLGTTPAERLLFLRASLELVGQRDDLSIEYVSLLNHTGEPESALEILTTRRFHPWEGGEGKVSGQYVLSHILLGQVALDAGKAQEALTHFQAAREYPSNLGEAKHLLTPETHLHYFAGQAHRALSDEKNATSNFQQAANQCADLSEMTYYQALALRALGDEAAATFTLRQLLESAQKQKQCKVTIDFFATSLPDFLIFEDDLDRRNQVHCEYLMGLALMGLGERSEAENCLRQVREWDVHYQGLEQLTRKP